MTTPMPDKIVDDTYEEWRERAEQEQKDRLPKPMPDDGIHIPRTRFTEALPVVLLIVGFALGVVVGWTYGRCV